MGYEFMLGRRPYNGRNRKEIREHILTKQAEIKIDELPYKWSPKAADFINQVHNIWYFSYCKEIHKKGWVGMELKKSNNIHGWLMSIGDQSKRKVNDLLTFLWASRKTMMTTNNRYRRTQWMRMQRKPKWCWEIKKCKLCSLATSSLTPRLSARRVCVQQTALIPSTFRWGVLGSEVIVLITIYIFDYIFFLFV